MLCPPPSLVPLALLRSVQDPSFMPPVPAVVPFTSRSRLSSLAHRGISSSHGCWEPSETRQLQLLCARSFPLSPSMSCPALCIVKSVIAGNKFHHRDCSALSPSQLYPTDKVLVGKCCAPRGQRTSLCIRSILWCSTLAGEAAACCRGPSTASGNHREAQGGGQLVHPSCTCKLPTWPPGSALCRASARRLHLPERLPGGSDNARAMRRRQTTVISPFAQPRQRHGGCWQRVRSAVLKFRERGVLQQGMLEGARDCLDSCLQNHVALRHRGDALPFKDHKRFAT